MKLEIFSDLICPWCFIGKRRLEEALKSIDQTQQIVWKPFLLNKTMPENGMERKAYRIQKFGNLEYSDKLDWQVIEAGKTCGIDFKFNDRSPNTILGHKLVLFSKDKCHQNDLMESLFEAYFCLNQDIGDKNVLVEIGSEHGLNSDDLLNYLKSEQAQQDLDSELTVAANFSINAVPAFTINSKLAFSGAQSPSVIKDILARSLLIIIVLVTFALPSWANADEQELELGIALLKQKNYENALPHLISQTKKDPKKQAAFYYAANCFERLGEINKAITFYKKVIELDQNSKFAELSSDTLSHHLQGYTSPKTSQDALKELPLRERIVVVPPAFGHPAVSSDVINTAKHVIMRLPAHIYRMLDKAGTVIYIAPNATDKFPEAIKNIQKTVETKLPLSQENGRTYNQDIYIYEYATTQGTKLGPKRLVSDMINNLMHEIGHAINNCQENYANDREYMELLKLDIDTITPETKEYLRIYTRNTEASAQEQQAEVAAYLLGSRTRSALTIGSQFAYTRNYVRRKLSL